jgi:hypothetical protein
MADVAVGVFTAVVGVGVGVVGVGVGVVAAGREGGSSVTRGVMETDSTPSPSCLGARSAA